MQHLSRTFQWLEAHSRTHEWLKPHRLICEEWALPILRAVPPVALIFRVSQLSTLTALISRTAEFPYKELQWISAELRDEALRHGRELVKKMEHDQIAWSRECLHSCKNHHIMSVLTDVIKSYLLSLPQLKAFVKNGLESGFIGYRFWFSLPLHICKTKF